MNDKVIIDFSKKKEYLKASELGLNIDSEILKRLRIPRRPDWRKFKN